MLAFSLRRTTGLFLLGKQSLYVARIRHTNTSTGKMKRHERSGR